MIRQPEKILIVDDEEQIRRLLHAKLSSEGFKCWEAANAEQALEKLRNDVFSLVLLDIRMPGMSGDELLPLIKTSYPDVAVIMATAVGGTKVGIECMKRGAYDYITKPFILDEVVLNVDRALEKRKLELENKEYRQQLEAKVAEQARKIRTSFLSAITALAYALEAKDRYTGGHSQRVAGITVAIAVSLGLPQENIDKIKLAGLIHDVGKIGVRESVLNKPGRLNDEEMKHIQKHPEIGERLLAPVAEDEEILRWVRHHHERYDGTGYPDRAGGDRIPLGARILAVADAFEAMISERPYRSAMTEKAALAEIERGAGAQFDPMIAEVLLRNKRKMDTILGSLMTA